MSKVTQPVNEWRFISNLTSKPVLCQQGVISCLDGSKEAPRELNTFRLALERVCKEEAHFRQRDGCVQGHKDI